MDDFCKIPSTNTMICDAFAGISDKVTVVAEPLPVNVSVVNVFSWSDNSVTPTEPAGGECRILVKP